MLRIALVVVGVLAIPVVLVAAGCVFQIQCSIDLTYLPALRADPMATVVLPGTALTDESAHGHTISLTTSRASMSRDFRILNQEEAGLVLAEAVEYAESVGWVFQQHDEWSHHGTKDLEPGLAWIYLAAAPRSSAADPGARGLQVKLGFKP